MPEITIVIPTLNCGEFIEDCLRSLRIQIFQDFEVIFVDGGSIDATIPRLKAIKDLKVRIFTSYDGGVPGALNIGFNKAESNILCWLNADDFYISPYSLSLVYRAFRFRSNIFVAGGMGVFDQDLRCIGSMMSWRVKPKYFSHGANFFTGSLFFSRSDWESFGGFSGKYLVAFEYELVLFLVTHSKVSLLDFYLTGFRRHPKQLSQLKKNQMNTEFELILGERRETRSALSIWLRISAEFREGRLLKVVSRKLFNPLLGLRFKDICHQALSLGSSAGPIVLVFDNFGPYHLARAQALAELIDVVCIQLTPRSATYSWNGSNISSGLKLISVFQEFERNPFKIHKAVNDSLVLANPKLVLIPGWSSDLAHSCIRWSLRARCRMIVMSASQAQDFKRNWAVELVKQTLLSVFDGALVGGHRQFSYLTDLGMPVSHLRVGYNVVDNSHFDNLGNIGRIRMETSSYSFLCICRFVPKKNLFRLIDAFSLLRKKVDQSIDLTLRLVGGGPLTPMLYSYLARRGRTPGLIEILDFVDYEHLPSIYKSSDVFVLPSISEQWGLVVNEAMASGLPVAISRNCGCVDDLVSNGINGYLFDPYSTEEICNILQLFIKPKDELIRMGHESQKIIKKYDPSLFAKSVFELTQLSMIGRSKAKFITANVLYWLLLAIRQFRYILRK